MTIAKATIDQFFKHNRDRGAPLNRVMLWGFFFTDHDRAKLERVIPSLEANGFRFVDIFGSDPEHPDPNDPDPDLLYLHVEKATTHTRASLFKACAAFDDLALEYELASFDGFDVGSVDGSSLFSA